MAYDSTLDKQIFVKTWETELVRLSVSVYSYNNNAKKLQISRETKDEEGGLRFAKLGRLTKEEAQGILPLIQEAISHLD